MLREQATGGCVIGRTGNRCMCDREQATCGCIIVNGQHVDV